MKTLKFLQVVFVVLLALVLNSCSLIGGIFKTGMDVGIFLTVAVIILIVVLVLRLGRRRN